MWMGWFIRGLHHFGSQAMMVLLVLHLLQALVAGAYRGPARSTGGSAWPLLVLTLGFSLTGYLLPWDQKGYWATKVATNIMGGAPVIGPDLKTVVVGGTEYGNQTLTRFYGLHVGLLPALMFALPGRPRRPVPPARPDRRRGSRPADRRAVLARAGLHEPRRQRRWSSA